MGVLKSRGISRDTLPFKAVWMPWFAHVTFWMLCVIIFIQGYSCFFHFNATDFFTNYVSLILFFVLWLGAQLTYYRKEPWLIPYDQVDIDSDSRVIDEQVWDDKDMSKFEKFWDNVL
ncbi:unnamed protein product [Ambrosiozyma monospora]|uniref:Unnamed protein product n=1 Tax=Ambrosiozyma monospora TaxID=43982 RepID=A0A9W6Z7F1_AMBMO|nr:unnamed protein product [Ambrosiozyma monospora]